MREVLLVEKWLMRRTTRHLEQEQLNRINPQKTLELVQN
jgi:hypothetical protein